MAKKDKYYMPSSWAGLLRFTDEEKNKIKLKPEYVVYIGVGIIVVEVLLRLLFPMI